jgi:hypothetical protein
MASSRVGDWRNFTLGMGYLVVCALFGYWSPDTIPQMGAPFTGLGVGVTGVVGMRAANKWAENGKGNGNGATPTA